MGDGSKLVQTIQKISQVPTQDQAGIVIGTVTSVTPLKIKVGDKLELTETFLILSPFVQTVTIDVLEPESETPGHLHVVPQNSTGWAGDPIHSHSVNQISTQLGLTQIVLWKGLELNDVVYLLRVDKGQKYYVLQKQGGIGI